MEATVANHDARGNPATAQANNPNIILGCHRITANGWAEVLGMVINGCGLVREGNAFRLIHSEAFEQLVLS